MALIISKENYEAVKNAMIKTGIVPELSETTYGEITLIIKAGEIVANKVMIKNNIEVNE